MRARLLLAVVLFVLLLTGHARAEDDLRTLVKGLGDADATTRSQSYRALLQANDPACVPLLRRALPELPLYGQYLGLLVLDRFPYKTTRKTWQELSSADAAYLRLASGKAQLEGGDDCGAAIAVGALTAEDADYASRIYMLLRIGTRPDRRLLPGVRGLLKPDMHVNVLARALSVLHASRDLHGVPAMVALLQAGSPGVKAMTAAVLCALGQREYAAALAEAIRGGIGSAELVFVDTILATRSEIEDEVLEAVTARLSEETNATLLVRWIGILDRSEHRTARKALESLLAHDDETVARAAFDAWLDLGASSGNPDLRAMLSTHHLGRRLWVAEAMRQRGDDAGLATVVYVLQAGTVPQRTAAVQALAAYRKDHAVRPLIAALADADAGVRAVALPHLQTVLRWLFPYRFLDLASTGYAPDAPADLRAAAVERIRAWWEANRDADW